MAKQKARAQEVHGTPWRQIELRYEYRYRQATGKRFDLSLITDIAVGGERQEGEDRVAYGFARKAWATMRCTCEHCGRPGKARRGKAGELTVVCSACQLPYTLRQALETVYGDELDATGIGPKKVWHEHELPALMQAVLPEHLWCHTTLSGGEQLRYVTASDLASVRPWFAALESRVLDNWAKQVERAFSGDERRSE